MKKRLFSLLLCITVLFSTVLDVEASATTGTMTDTEMQKMYDFIFSEETNKLINSSIDFNQYGTQTVNSLYYNGNINNTDTIVIYCDHNGVITKN